MLPLLKFINSYCYLFVSLLTLYELNPGHALQESAK